MLNKFIFSDKSIKTKLISVVVGTTAISLILSYLLIGGILFVVDNDVFNDFALYHYRWEITAGLSAIGLGCLFSYFVSSKLQDFITKPIFHLSALTMRLTEQQDYSLRAMKFSDDEIGDFTNSFNTLIERMETYRNDIQSARSDAETANKKKSAFLAMMSHEIRTPINGVMGTTELLSETKLTGRQREYVDIIEKSARTLFDLINDVLDFSKIEAEKLKIEKIPFDLTDHIHDIIDISQIQVAQKGLRLLFKNNLSSDYQVIGDPVRIKQIIINLVSNAVKFTHQGSVTISLDEENHNTPSTRNIIIRVSDTGIGIPQDRHDVIFDSFTQADDATTRQYGGTGLGLAICKKLVEMMGGEIAVESTEGQGSKFWFSIPMKVSKSIDLKSIILPTIAHAKEGLNKILFVEDNETNIMITNEVLKQAGYDVTIARDGAEATSLYFQNDYDLVLMDCQMPIMDGWEATERIRAFEENQKRNRTLIVALTANAMEGDRDRCLAVGMDDYLSKPFKKHELLDKLNALITSDKKAS